MCLGYALFLVLSLGHLKKQSSSPRSPLGTRLHVQVWRLLNFHVGNGEAYPQDEMGPGSHTTIQTPGDKKCV